MTPEQLSAEVQAFIASAKAKAVGGLTVAEFGALVVELLRLLTSGLDTISSLDKPAKKAWALGCIGILFDTVAGYAVPLPFQPFWIIFRPVIRQLVLAAADGALEKVLTLTRAAAQAVAA
jgi:hypothetical protein